MMKVTKHNDGTVSFRMDAKTAGLIAEVMTEGAVTMLHLIPEILKLEEVNDVILTFETAFVRPNRTLYYPYARKYFTENKIK